MGVQTGGKGDKVGQGGVVGWGHRLEVRLEVEGEPGLGGADREENPQGTALGFLLNRAHIDLFCTLTKIPGH